MNCLVHFYYYLLQYTALELGCKVLTETEVTGFEWISGLECWQVRLKSGSDQPETTLHVKSVVNCAGNYSDEVNRMNSKMEDFR